MTEIAQTEIWKNVTNGTVFVRRLDHRGELSRHEQVNSNRNVTMTTEERRVNQELSANERQDPFRNGILQPIRVLGEDAEIAELSSNPNSMAESDMIALLKGHHKTFEARVNQVQNTVTLERLLAVAYEEDCSVKKVERIKARIVEVGGGGPPVSTPAPSVSGAREPSVFGRPMSPR